MFKCLYFGSCEFSIAGLQRLLFEYRGNSKSVIKSLDILTTSRHTPLKSYAERNGLTVHSLSNENHNKWDLVDYSKYDFGLVVSFGNFIPSSVISAFRKGSMNLHPSMLPKYRGPAPIQHAIMNGDKYTAVSIITLSPEKFDTGLILKQSDKIQISRNDTFHTLSARLSSVGSSMLYEVVRDYDHYKDTARQQGSADCNSHARKIKKDMCTVDLNNDSVFEITNKYRGISHHFPLHLNHSIIGTVYLKSILLPFQTAKELRLLKSSGRLNSTQMWVFNDITNTLFFKCQPHIAQDTALEHSWLGVKMIQVGDRHPVDAKTFLFAYPDFFNQR
ncbi:hypothetical protein MP638_006903 [Amoeboaphelidium occidentale]|nr:hypothetical protein MP638_006903 [Amoeboaphelidium occidentale]